MVENFNDILSLLSLASIPVLAFVYLLCKKVGHRKEKIIVNSEKYYREW